MDIIGHSDIREKLRNLVLSNNIGHAYLFLGKDGIGKKLVALEFVKSIMCLNNANGNFCNSCEACNTFETASDFLMISPEKNIIKVDDIRNLSNEIYLKPTKASRKCFIIDDADMMNESAQNALLKVLEEPPLYATIILISSNKEKLLNTILSRVVLVNFKTLSNDEISSILGDSFDKNIINYARGSVSKALKLSNEKFIDFSRDFYDILLKKDFLSINRKFEELKADKLLKANISSILEIIELICYSNIKSDILYFTNLINILDETNKNIQRNANLDLALDNMILSICF